MNLKNRRGSAEIVFAIGILALGAVLSIFLIMNHSSLVPPSPAPIPTPSPNPTPAPIPPTPPSSGGEITLREGEREGPLLVQKIYPTYVTGLAYREYPLAVSEGSPITLHIGESVSNGCTITLTLRSINGSSATFRETKDFNRPCPICLAQGTLIATPSGENPIESLKPGDLVWTTDVFGKRISAPIIAIAKTPVPLTHQVVDVKLADGRELLASEGHPTSDGRFIGNLVKGDLLDGSRILSADRITYYHGHTYDILPFGNTGNYWANNILIGSTLIKK